MIKANSEKEEKNTIHGVNTKRECAFYLHPALPVLSLREQTNHSFYPVIGMCHPVYE